MAAITSTLPVKLTSDFLSLTSIVSDDNVQIRAYDEAPLRTDADIGGRETTVGFSRKAIPPAIEAKRNLTPSANSIPMQIWEGIVESFDLQAWTMEVSLEAKLSHMPKHAATISLDWVHDQDMALINRGAVFYLTLYKQMERSTVRNSQEIRFRRMPSWSRTQIRQIEDDAKIFASNFLE